jgi:hypothetical protein
MKKYIFDFRFILVAALILFLIIYLVPFQVEYTVSSYAKIQPSQQWVISRGNDGLYISSIKDMSNGVNGSYIVNQFERGASVEVRLKDGLRANQIVEAGDTIGIIYSSGNLQRYIELQGELNNARAELEVNLSGEKESVVSQVQHSLELAESEADKQAKLVERLRQLHEKNMVSEEEYQIASDELRTLNIAVGMKSAELQTVMTGAKSTEIQRLKVRIKSIEDQLKMLEKQMNSYNIVAPFTGRIERSISNDTLLILSDIKRSLAYIPVSIYEKDYLLPDSRISLSAGSRSYTASLLDINNTTEIVNNRQCVTLTAVIEGSEELNYGMIVPVEVSGKMLTIYEYLMSKVAE